MVGSSSGLKRPCSLAINGTIIINYKGNNCNLDISKQIHTFTKHGVQKSHIQTHATTIKLDYTILIDYTVQTSNQESLTAPNICKCKYKQLYMYTILFASFWSTYSTCNTINTLVVELKCVVKETVMIAYSWYSYMTCTQSLVNCSSCCVVIVV